MGFKDIFKKSFLNAFETADVSLKSMIITMAIVCVFAIFIFFFYRMMTRKTFYNKSFNISLAVTSIIVAAIIITIQSNIVISLGMVGALSIVRYRTAIKDPMDLAFLFWSISVGIICGAGLPGIAVIASVVIAICIVAFDAIPVAKAPMLLVVNASDKSVKEIIINTVKNNTKVFNVKSQTIKSNSIDMIIEVRSKDNNSLVDSISAIDGVVRCSLVSHDGEVTF